MNIFDLIVEMVYHYVQKFETSSTSKKYLIIVLYHSVQELSL